MPIPTAEASPPFSCTWVRTVRMSYCFEINRVAIRGGVDPASPRSGYKFEFQPGVRNMDAFSSFYFYATGVTPAMEAKMVGQGCQYAAAFANRYS